MTSAQLAEQVGLSHDFIRQIESEKARYNFSVETFCKIAAALERLGRFEDFVDSGVQGQGELSEQLAALLPQEVDRYKDALTPAIILIPGKEGSLGIGMANVKTAVERAVGADIL